MQKSKTDPKPDAGPASKPTGVAPRKPRPNRPAAAPPLRVEFLWRPAKVDDIEKNTVESAIKKALQTQGHHGHYTADIEVRLVSTIGSGKQANYSVMIKKIQRSQISLTYSLDKHKVQEIECFD
ncbi:uncharacterized protein B0T15DRAFT_506060 [Chaetomium strumarium]|uniref:Uncharacterized protein n=1 Tax=Chaetomium strumarium TaxID=1170767 RepID=A0AAJ0LXZ9_9PEZI|nr:hypothetical protein B0T15DRAFT_506060 [Chaetomium strumarium]